MSLPDDQPVRHQSFQNQVKSWISNSLFDKFTYTIRRGPIKGMKRKGGLAWIPDWLVKDHRTPEQKLFTDLELDDKVVFDVGAFEGLTTLLFARRARRVVSYEPNPRNAARLLHNLKLNDVHNVTVRQTAVGAALGTAEIAWHSTAPAFPRSTRCRAARPRRTMRRSTERWRSQRSIWNCARQDCLCPI